MHAISAQHLSKSYGAIAALRDVSFTVERGEVIGLLGQNGAGKTTLMKILTGYIEPDTGDAFIHDIDVVNDRLDAQARIGYLPESAPLYTDMIVQDYLSTMAALRGVPDGKRQDAIIDAARAVGLLDRLVQPIGTLSKGYRQRVGLAQAIIHRPDVLILDEPTTGLDPTQIGEIRELIRRLAKDTTILLSTHILAEVEAVCGRALIIMGGALQADKTIGELTTAAAGSASAVVSIEASADAAADKLRGVRGVTNVATLGTEAGFTRYRVVAKQSDELCPLIFEALRAEPWKVAELRTEANTLEHVFTSLAKEAR